MIAPQTSVSTALQVWITLCTWMTDWAYCLWITDWAGLTVTHLDIMTKINLKCQWYTWEEHFSRKTDAEPMAETTARTPLKLFRSCSTIIISTIRDIIATRSSKFSASTIFFSNHLVNCEQILVSLINCYFILFGNPFPCYAWGISLKNTRAPGLHLLYTWHNSEKSLSYHLKNHLKLYVDFQW
jgi:hypothetical protein